MGFNVEIEPVVLRGDTVKLVPIQIEHAPDLYESTREIEWKMLPTNFISSSQMESGAVFLASLQMERWRLI